MEDNPLSRAMANHFRQMYDGGSWTEVGLKEQMKDVDWKMATHHFEGMNSIASLTYHITYYIHEVLKVLKGGYLEAKDKHSWELPPVKSQQDWESLLDNIWRDIDAFVVELEKMKDDRYWTSFAGKKYGHYFSNLLGLIEHFHYHLGQIVILKKLYTAQISSNEL